MMKSSKIVFATDFSSASEPARHVAMSLARDSGAELILVHVVEPPPLGPDRGYGGYIEASEHDEASKAELAAAMPDKSSDIEARSVTLRGKPAEEIVKLASDEAADLIVIGSHGRGGLMRMLLGSVAEEVVRKAGCAVLTVKQPDTSNVNTEAESESTSA